MPLKPWYKIVTPREDLREGKPLDASEFAVHLDQVREGNAPADYQKPERFFERTYLTKNLASLASEVIRRLSGENTETNAVFNLATQFGGGKTHALTLLYHLARSGPAANKWAGVSTLLAKAGVAGVPKAEAAVFVGTEFDSITGRGGKDGTPLRKTPWGEIAWQLGREKSFAFVAEHDKKGEAPGGEVIRQLLPKDKPSLILMDELMNYVSRNRRGGLGGQLYNFLQNLSEVARSTDNVVLAVSIPASELEMTAEDQSDFERFKKVLDRLGKAIVMSSDAETSEIIRRRLFEWDERAVTSEGKVMLPKEALETCVEYANWVVDHRQQLPSQFNVDGAREAFLATYPFHPAVISVFERKWQALPRFQQTRGILRLLALWVSRAYTKVLSKFASARGLRLTVKVEASPEGGVSNLEPPLSFNGQMLGHEGFLLAAEQGEKIVSTDHISNEVTFPYLDGEEMLTGGTPDRFVLDFGTKNRLETCSRAIHTGRKSPMMK